MAAIRASGIVKRFETTPALVGVDLELGLGELRGLLGPNGAGKTTLLRVLFGLVRPDAGRIELFDQALEAPRSVPLDGVAGFVEEPSFYPYMSGRANLELLAELDGIASAAPVEDALEQVGLASRGADRVSGYSSGMKQRLGIAAALLRAPRLLLLDEPTAGLDPEGVRQVGALLRRLASEEGVAILLSSHQIGEIEQLCDSFTVLRRGEVVWSGTAGELRAQAPPSSYRLSTSDDARAQEIAFEHDAVRVVSTSADGLALDADDTRLDSFVLALGQAGVAVRRLELRVSPLESMFFALTAEPSADAPLAPASSPGVLART